MDDVRHPHRLEPRADALHPPDPLLHGHRIPGQVVIHEDVRLLKIDPLGAGIGRHYDVDLRLCLPKAFDGPLVLGCLAARDEAMGDTLRGEYLPEHELRFAPRREHHHPPVVPLGPEIGDDQE